MMLLSRIWRKALVCPNAGKDIGDEFILKTIKFCQHIFISERKSRPHSAGPLFGGECPG